MTETIVLYLFDELNDEAKKAAIEENRFEPNTDYVYDCVIDNWKTKLENLGYSDVKISWTGFGSQGDGASFTADVNDIYKFVSAHALKNTFKYLTGQIRRENADLSIHVYRTDWQYYHWNTVGVSHDLSVYDDDVHKEDRLDGLADTLATYVKNEVRDLSRKIYKDLEDAFDDTLSDEYISGYLTAYDYLFMKDGTSARYGDYKLRSWMLEALEAADVQIQS